MRPVGMCRMCLVEVDTGRGPALQPSCMVTVSEGMTVDTESPAVQKAQEGVLEFLLVNHPLDCPVCDKGGECPLQDQTMAYGPGESRFVEIKRHFPKPIPISQNVYLDRERCILCDRCTRFAKEVSGDPLIHFMDRGSSTQVNTFPDLPFSSYFSGNTVQICPVGALTAKPYRFKARPWDLDETPSTFPNAMGDRIVVESSRDEVLRIQGMDSEAVNWGWLSDRDRFSFQAIHHPDRLGTPMIRSDTGELVSSTWGEALDTVANAVIAAVESRGAQSVAVIGGAQLTCESQYLWTKLAKSVWRSDNVDAQLDDGLAPEVVLGLPRATIAEACGGGGDTGGASTILLLGADPKEELGTLYLRLRPLIEAGEITLVEVGPCASGLSDVATHSLQVLPGDVPEVVEAMLADDPVAHARSAGTPEGGQIGVTSVAEIVEVAKVLRSANSIAERAGVGDNAEVPGADANLTVILGRNSLGESAEVNASVAVMLAEAFPRAKFLPALRRANIHGALEMGMSPGWLPGRQLLGATQDAATQAGATQAGKLKDWGALPDQPGRDTRGILQAMANGEIAVLVCLGADIHDCPDADLVDKALMGGATIISVDTLPNATNQHSAAVVLPATGFCERDGTHINLEGRLSPTVKRVTPPGSARDDWMIATELAERCGTSWNYTSAHDIRDEMDAILPQTSPETPSPAIPAVHSLLSAIKPPPPVPHDRYSFRLHVPRSLYDNGTIVSHSPALSPLVSESVARLNPDDMQDLGITDLQEIKLVSQTGDQAAEITIPAKADSRVTPGVVSMAWKQTGADPRRLLKSGTTATEIRITVS